MPPGVLSPRMVRIVEDLACDWRRLDERVEGLSNEIKTIARQTGCERLMSVPGIETTISSAMVAAIGAGDVITKPRFCRLARARSQADLDRGPYHPWQGIQAWQSLPASSVRAGGVGHADQPKIWERHGLKPWLEAARKRLHHNVLAIAFADKLARIAAWSVLARGRAFEVRKINQAAPQAT